MWIDEIELAKRLWEEEKMHQGFGNWDFEEVFFRLIINNRVSRGVYTS